MTPSTNLLAIVMAYDPFMPLPADKEQYRALVQQFMYEIQPLDEAIAPLFDSYGPNEGGMQWRYDTLLSIAIDAGLDTLFSFPLPSLVADKASKSQLRHAIAEVPSFLDTLRPGMDEQFKRYGLAVPSRRQTECDLFFGISTIVMAPALNSEGKRTIAPTVLHPLLRFISAASCRK